MSANLTPSEAEIRLYDRLSIYAEAHQIPLQMFWSCQRYCLTLEEFISMVEDSGFIIFPEEINDIKDNGVELINLDAVLNHVAYWKEQEGSVGAFASKQIKSKKELAVS